MEQPALDDELARTREQLESALRDLRRSEALRRDSQDRETMLAVELQHRVRNTLAIIRSVFSRTMDTATSLENASDHFGGRLDTVARHQSQFTHRPGGTIDLDTLVRDELLTFGFGDGDQVTIEGPAAQLPYKTAELIGLAVHELATNSVKFGALAGERSRLAIRWNVENRGGTPQLDLAWQESGVPVMSPAPLRTGFGREFIEQALPYQLEATTSFELRPGGLSCRISLPLGSPDRA